MYFQTLNDFINMGGYAIYVWSAFAITFGALLLLLIVSICHQNSVLKHVKKRKDRLARIEAAKDLENTL
ncbi:heme exporter protein CcmD [Vibrio sp. S4M6]|uniref:heme exporter protein CcmD n=1 Tax=Vibrio sinus TaxID=2946865 RepID=UPI00202A7BD1|nr:heme exporter protein CcmD [Vibrio sinus]MCL9781821.1 heme exporter protein CcmD [Vibrio sinus]